MKYIFAYLIVNLLHVADSMWGHNTSYTPMNRINGKKYADNVDMIRKHAMKWNISSGEQ